MKIRYGKTLVYPDAYDDVTKLMRRLEKKGLARAHPKVSKYKPTLWSKPGIKDFETDDNIQHELDCTDLYVAYWPSYPTGLQYWDWQWQLDEKHLYETYKKDGFSFDGRMKYRGNWFFWEVDRGTKSLDQLEDQVLGYIKFAARVPDPYFRVLFTLQYSRWGFTYADEDRQKNINRRARFLLDLLNRHKTGNRFLVARHSEVLENPLGQVFTSPLDEYNYTSLDGLTAKQKAG